MLHGSWIGQGLAQFLMSRISIKKIKNMFRKKKKTEEEDQSHMNFFFHQKHLLYLSFNLFEFCSLFYFIE